MKYTHNNAELRLKDKGKKVYLKGWVSNKRNLGGLIFIDLRDMHGITQIAVAPENKNYKLASSLRKEYVIEVKGKVIERVSKNKDLPTGDIEIEASEIILLNEAENPPIYITDGDKTLEETRLKYRYLDLRRPSQKDYLVKRAHIVSAIRKSLESQGFLELETPILSKSTPEGARDYLVPSRLYPGEFYALPQSPQIYKQLFMIGGFEKYYQIARCFRDEDLRADRQPEFTQVDIEASFVEKNDIMEVVEKVFKDLFKECLDINLKTPFRHIKYDEAISKYGSDKPDLRFGLEIEDYSFLINESNPVFKDKETLRGILVEDGSSLTRKKIDKLVDLARKNHAETLAFTRFKNGEYSGGISKFLKEKDKEKLNLKDENLLLLIPGKYEDVSKGLGAVRLELARLLDLIKSDQYEFAWITDWPLLEYDEELERYVACHHPFTAPESHEKLLNDPENCKAKAYDIVLNGYEAGGGSIRIHNQETQKLMFEKLGLSEKAIDERFGFLVEALKYGTPPHGGIALGLDRIVMIMTNTSNIKDVIAFPKTQAARDLMNESPSKVDQVQLDELKINLKK